MMLKAAFATLLLFGLGAGPGFARDMHRVADEYINSDASIADRELALAILCLAAGLPDRDGRAAQEDIEAVGKIQRLAGKIIGNGSPVVVGTPRPKLAAAATTIIVLPKPKPGPAHNTESGTAIACEADKLMQRMQPGRASMMKPGLCTNADGSRDAIILRVNKIIGNG